jgi:hypothetical protein
MRGNGAGRRKLPPLAAAGGASRPEEWNGRKPYELCCWW